MDAFNNIMFTIAIIIADAIPTFFIMLDIRVEAKKKYNKNVKTYPYFSYPFYKRLFLLGLKKALSLVVVVLTFIAHISVILTIASCICWFCLASKTVADLCLRVLAGICSLNFVMRLGCPLAFPVNL